MLPSRRLTDAVPRAVPPSDEAASIYKSRNPKNKYENDRAPMKDFNVTAGYPRRTAGIPTHCVPTGSDIVNIVRRHLRHGIEELQDRGYSRKNAEEQIKWGTTKYLEQSGGVGFSRVYRQFDDDWQLNFPTEVKKSARQEYHPNDIRDVLAIEYPYIDYEIKPTTSERSNIGEKLSDITQEDENFTPGTTRSTTSSPGRRIILHSTSGPYPYHGEEDDTECRIDNNSTDKTDDGTVTTGSNTSQTAWPYKW